MQIKLIFTRKVLRLASFWKREFWELGKGQLTNTMVSSTRIRIFLKTEICLYFRKKNPHPRVAFSPFHSKTLTDDRNTIASFTGHALYDVWRHRIENLRFRSSTRKKYARFFLKKIHSGTAFSKSGVSSARNRRWRVDGKLKRRKISVFKIPRYAWMGKKYWSLFLVYEARSSLDVSWWVSRLQKQTNDL